MQSLWPFTRNTSSPASYEKALAKLSVQITSNTTSLDNSRTRAYRSKSFWTLWSTLAYLIYTSVLVLVLGPQQWSLPHYAGLVGAPIVIYGVRQVVASFGGWRIERQQGKLRGLVRERDEKIRQLKKATRYDSTQELLDKYGGTATKPDFGEKQGPSKKKPKTGPSNPRGQGQQQQFQTMTGIGPPPTANIPGRGVPPTPPQRSSRSSRPEEIQRASDSETPPSFNRNAHLMSYPSPINSDLSPDEPGFAPNAFPTTPPLAPSSSNATYSSEPRDRWYDRILDVMLGEDETLAKNRLVLICASCRVVNGQAAPGVRTLDEIGRWRCGSCGAWNGVEKVAEREVGRIMKKIRQQKAMDQDNDSRPEDQYRETAESPGASLSVGHHVQEEEAGDADVARPRMTTSPPGDRHPSAREREVPDSADEDTSNDGREDGQERDELEYENEDEDVAGDSVTEREVPAAKPTAKRRSTRRTPRSK